MYKVFFTSNQLPKRRLPFFDFSRTFCKAIMISLGFVGHIIMLFEKSYPKFGLVLTLAPPVIIHLCSNIKGVCSDCNGGTRIDNDRPKNFANV